MYRIVFILLFISYGCSVFAFDEKKISTTNISVTGWYDSDSLILAFGGLEGSVIICISDSITNKVLILSSTNITAESHTLSIDIRELLQESYHIEILINSHQEYEGYLHTIRNDGLCCERHRNTPIPNKRNLNLLKKVVSY